MYVTRPTNIFSLTKDGLPKCNYRQIARKHASSSKELQCKISKTESEFL